MIITQEILNKLSAEAKGNPRLRMNYDLRNGAEDQSQRMLNALEPGTVLPIHRHTQSSETVVIIRGAIRENFFDENGTLIESIVLKHGCDVPLLVVPKGAWHNLECIEPNTIIYESKDGAYEPIRPKDILEV